MKIAVASDGTKVAGHFGHCESFRLYEADNGKIVKETVVPNPGHKPGFLPNFLGDLGAEAIICCGIGGGAVDIFSERGIKVVSGAQGEARQAVEDYLNGRLVSAGSVCHEHQYEGQCEK